MSFGKPHVFNYMHDHQACRLWSAGAMMVDMMENVSHIWRKVMPFGRELQRFEAFYFRGERIFHTFASGMKTEFGGPEMNAGKVAVLLITAALLVALFAFRTCSVKGKGDGLFHFDFHHRQYVETWLEISDFDELFRECQDSTFDWLFIAAIASVESKFDTTTSSYVGASGLMQMMPATYRQMLREMDIDTNLVSTELNVKAAVRYLHSLDRQYSFVSMPERLNFILASYNAGAGHIQDAMRLARRDGINRYKWENIAPVLQSLAFDSVYTDSLCRNGQFMGIETVQYVEKVQRKYRQYRQQNLEFRATQRLGENLMYYRNSQVEIQPLEIIE